MKVLFVTCQSEDYIASCLWDGFQELCGEENVYDAVNWANLHSWGGGRGVCDRISASRCGQILESSLDVKFDLMVLNSCITRTHDWHLPIMLKDTRLKADAKIALIEGYDGCTEMVVPSFSVDAVFRREIYPGFDYPYKPNCLMMAFPSRWINKNADRPIDVFYGGANVSESNRWRSCSMAFSTIKKHRSIISSYGLFGQDEYFGYLSKAKLAICPTGAAGCFDCLRTWESVANGAIPVFVGFPDRIKNPWFEDDEYFKCNNADELPNVIDEALGKDLNSIRVKMQSKAIAEHTTAARAKFILDVLGGKT